jgi:hypothetical protein
VWVAMQDVDSPQGTFKKGRLVPDDDPVLGIAHDGWFRRLSAEELEVLGLVEVPVLESLGEKRVGSVVVRIVR